MWNIKKPDGNYLEMNKQKALNLLGLSMRAGKLISGEGLTLNEVRSGKAKLVLVATDASENTIKKIQDKCSYYNVQCICEFTQAEISQAIGKHRMICGICDRGFARSFYELIQS